MNALELKNIEYTYSRNTPFENKVLDGISVSFEEGKTGVMITINRTDLSEYSVYFDSADISSIANGVKSVPQNYINSEGNRVTEECIRYLAPLIYGEVFPVYENGLPKHIVL